MRAQGDIPPPMGTPIGRVDAVWLRLRAALGIRAWAGGAGQAWAGPERWLRGMGLDPARLDYADAECAAIAMEADRRGLERRRRGVGHG